MEEINEECPIDLGIVGEVSGIKYNDGEATMTLIFDEDVPIDLTSLSNKTNILKTTIMSAYADNEDLNEVFKAVLNANAAFPIKIKQKQDESQ